MEIQHFRWGLVEHLEWRFWVRTRPPPKLGGRATPALGGHGFGLGSPANSFRLFVVTSPALSLNGQRANQQTPPTTLGNVVCSFRQLIPSDASGVSGSVQQHHGHQSEEFPGSGFCCLVAFDLRPALFPQSDGETVAQPTSQKMWARSQRGHSDSKPVVQLKFVQHSPTLRKERCTTAYTGVRLCSWSLDILCWTRLRSGFAPGVQHEGTVRATSRAHQKTNLLSR